MTEYTLRVPTAIYGDLIPLFCVAERMACHAASGYGTLPLHGPTLKSLQLIHNKSLLSAARTGRLPVCNQAGYQGTVDEIIEAAKNSGGLFECRQYLVEPDWEKLHRDNPPMVGIDVGDFTGIDLGATETDWDMTYLLSLYVRKQHLIDWGNDNGDVFHIVDMPVDVFEFGPKDEHGEFAFRGMLSRTEPAAKGEGVPVVNTEAPMQGEPPAAQTETKAKRINGIRAFLMSCIDKGIPPNIESIWLHIRDNASNENFLFKSASQSTATTVDDKQVKKKNLGRALGNLLKTPNNRQETS
jgi:hypothetical protein